MKEKDAMQIAKALGDPMRFRIFRQISEADEVRCGEISDERSITAGTVSHHLKVLAQIGLIIISRRDGPIIYYRCVPEKLTAYLEYLNSFKFKRSV